MAQGADVLIATEHDVVVDLGTIARQLGLGDRLTVVGGAELTGCFASSLNLSCQFIGSTCHPPASTGLEPVDCGFGN